MSTFSFDPIYLIYILAAVSAALFAEGFYLLCFTGATYRNNVNRRLPNALQFRALLRIGNLNRVQRRHILQSAHHRFDGGVITWSHSLAAKFLQDRRRRSGSAHHCHAARRASVWLLF